MLSTHQVLGFLNLILLNSLPRHLACHQNSWGSHVSISNNRILLILESFSSAPSNSAIHSLWVCCRISSFLIYVFLSSGPKCKIHESLPGWLWALGQSPRTTYKKYKPPRLPKIIQMGITHLESGSHTLPVGGNGLSVLFFFFSSLFNPVLF